MKPVFRKEGLYHVRWYGSQSPSQGYGASNLAMLAALEATRVRTHSAPDPSVEYAVGIAYAACTVAALEELGTPYRILFTMFEADRWPPQWVNAANCANQLWVPSEFCRAAAVESGVETPVHLVPLGFDPAVYNTDGRTSAGETGPYVFGFAGTASRRKGFDILVRAFREEFQDGEPVRLELQCASLLSSTVPKDNRILIRVAPVPMEAMAEFYRSVDCLVMPTRGEGFGLTPLEAMACGCCVAVTDWGGCREYLGPDTLKIAIDGTERCPDYHASPGSWARPSLASTRYCMRWAYEHREEAQRMGMVAAGRVRREFPWSVAAERIEWLLRRVNPADRIAVERQQVVVWRGDPANVTTCVGGFTREIPRRLTADQVAKLNPSDIGPQGFAIEERYFRADGSE